MAMLNLLCSALLCCPLFGCVSGSEEIKITAGQNVTLTCRAPNSNIVVVEWSRADLGSDYVLFYRDGQFNPDYQHPSFMNRVDLQDRQMKDGDVSLILKDVTTADEGTYECRVIQRGTNRRRRAHLKTAPVNIIYLRVVAPPPGPGGGATEDEEEEDGVSRGRPGLIAGLSVSAALSTVVGFWIFRNPNQQQSCGSNRPPAEQQNV